MRPGYVFLASVVGTVESSTLIFYLLAYIAARYDARRAREYAAPEAQPADTPLPAP